MPNSKNAIRRILDQLDSPMMKIARDAQEKINAQVSPHFNTYLESYRSIEEIFSPAVRSILDNQKHIRLGLNPQIQEFLDIKSFIDPPDYLSMFSKWASNADTPLSVYEEFKFHKFLNDTELPYDQLNTYHENFERIQKLLSDISTVKYPLHQFERFDYTLIEEENTEPESQIILLDEGSRIKRIIKDIYKKNQGIYTLNPNDFEDMIAELLRFQQFEVEMTKRTRDGGYDLIAVKNIGEFPVRFLVECKRHAKARKVGVGIVRSFRDVINTDGANKGIIVTSSYFSPDAEKERLRNKPYMLDFKDHDDVIGWVNKYVN
nr:restriction endonuclease [Mucilaginibacter sp. L294]